MKVTIVGGSGFIGTKLSGALLERGYDVIVIDVQPARIQNPHLTYVGANLADGTVSTEVRRALNGSRGVINLAGASIGRRWSESYKKLIYDSRVVTTRNLVSVISTLEVKPKVLVNASAVGYYGDCGSDVLTEEGPAGTDFLARLCVDWEEGATRLRESGVRVALIRTANVLGPGGLLASLTSIFKKGLGGYFGSGNQYMPWVHWKDIVGIYMYALEHNVSGPYNVGAGKTITQKELFKAFARSIQVPVVWRIPYILARLIFSGFADTLVASHNTDSSKIKKAGYVYGFEDIHHALDDVR